jgi:hypothetical protein
VPKTSCEVARPCAINKNTQFGKGRGQSKKRSFGKSKGLRFSVGNPNLAHRLWPIALCVIAREGVDDPKSEALVNYQSNLKICWSFGSGFFSE